MDMPADSQILDIMKWVGLAFVAGFIGYFGRYLGMYLIDKMRRRKQRRLPTTAPVDEIASEKEDIMRGIPPAREDTIEEAHLKLEKKRAKTLAKNIKKEQKD